MTQIKLRLNKFNSIIGTNKIAVIIKKKQKWSSRGLHHKYLSAMYNKPTDSIIVDGEKSQVFPTQSLYWKDTDFQAFHSCLV